MDDGDWWNILDNTYKGVTLLGLTKSNENNLRHLYPPDDVVIVLNIYWATNCPRYKCKLMFHEIIQKLIYNTEWI